MAGFQVLIIIQVALGKVRRQTQRVPRGPGNTQPFPK